MVGRILLDAHVKDRITVNKQFENLPRVYFYINVLGGGGAERVITNLANMLAEDNYDVTMITSYEVEHEYILTRNVRRLSLEDKDSQRSRIIRNLSRIFKLRKICKEEKPDILISFMEEPNFRTILATRGLPVKTLVSVRNDPNKEYAGKIGRFVGKVLLPMADGCVFQTSDAQKWFPERLQKKSRIIYNAVKEEFYQVDRTPVRGEIVTCGRLTEQKNHRLLIDAFAEVQKIYPFATLKIYGEGILREKLQNQIDSLNLNEKVFLMGATNDVAKALKTAELFVLSSDYEGMPNALMEAMAAGVPCISTDCPCGGARELFGKELKKNLVECGNKKQLAEKLMLEFSENRIGTEERKRAALFVPERINAEWKKYVADITKTHYGDDLCTYMR